VATVHDASLLSEQAIADDHVDDESEPASYEDAPAAEPPIRSAPMAPVTRVWWTIAGLTIVMWAFQLFGYVDSYRWPAWRSSCSGFGPRDDLRRCGSPTPCDRSSADCSQQLHWR